MAGKINIPLVDLKREYTFLKNDIDRHLSLVFKNQRWILGPALEEFEKKARQYLGAKYALGVASGTDALILSLRAFAFKLKKKDFFDKEDEIITTPFTFIATAEAILRAGARPVFVDIDPHTFNINPSSVENAVTRNTVGIIPVHLYGLAAEMNSIMDIAHKYGLFVLEDAAQAFGAVYGSKRVGTIGTAGAFSFFPSKNLGGYGDAGLIAVNNSALYNYIKALRNHGQKRQYRADYLGYNSRMDSFQAAILLAKLKYIDKFNKMRRDAAEKYKEKLKDIKQIDLPIGRGTEYSHIYHLYTVKVSSGRNKLLRKLNEKGISARVYYPYLLSQMRAFEDCRVSGSLKNAKSILPKILTIPMHPFLREREIEYIADSIKRFFK